MSLYMPLTRIISVSKMDHAFGTEDFIEAKIACSRTSASSLRAADGDWDASDGGGEGDTDTDDGIFDENGIADAFELGGAVLVICPT